MSQGEPCVWSYPLDLHYSTTALQGWPKFHCEVGGVHPMKAAGVMSSSRSGARTAMAGIALPAMAFAM
eukprot:759932-Hanusia_phi.AAC.4